MVLIRALLLGLLILGVGAPSGALAHANHQRSSAKGAQVRAVPPSEMQQQMEKHVEKMEAEQPKSFVQRLTGWFGRMHPFAVHFPVALFPVALVALVLARRRGETVELIRALIVVAGAGSVLATMLGWLNGGLNLQDTDNILMLHRWVGTLLGLIGGATAAWAWRSRGSVESRTMVATLALTVALLFVQGFLGASVTHGWEHMMF